MSEHHDPLDRLTTFDPGVPMSPLPPSEVRRRGDRRRRRTTALTVIASAVAVAVIATPIAVLAHGRDQGPRPAHGGQDVWRHHIPADFPLTDRLPATNGDGTAVTVTDEAPTDQASECGESFRFPVTASSSDGDLAGVSYSGVRQTVTRTLALLPDAPAAHELFDQLSKAALACHSEILPSSYGDESLVNFEGPKDGVVLRGVTELVRVGNAVYLSFDDDYSTPSALQVQTRSQRQSAGVVDAMSLFAGPAATRTPSPTVTTTEQLVENNLLTPEELPVRSRLTPWKEQGVSGAPTLVCEPDGGIKGLRADSSISRGFGASIAPTADLPQGGKGISSRVRQTVLQFADTDAAAAAYAAVVPWVESCDDPGTVQRSRMSPDGAVQRVDQDGSTSEYRGWIYPADDLCSGCDAAYFDRMGVAQIGNRLVLVSLAEVGGPLEPSGLDSSMAELIGAAIDKAGPVSTPPPVDTSPPSSSDDSIPADFPIDQGLQADTGDGGEELGPSTTVGPVAFPAGFCGVYVWPAAGTRDRLAVSVSGPEYLVTRELVTFASPADAARVVDDMRDAAQRCRGTSDTQQDPVDYQVIPDTTGENSVSFGYTYHEGLGGEVYQFVQLGSAVLVQAGSGEFDGATLRAGVPDVTAQLTALFPAVCELTGDC